MVALRESGATRHFQDRHGGGLSLRQQRIPIDALEGPMKKVVIFHFMKRKVLKILHGRRLNLPEGNHRVSGTMIKVYGNGNFPNSSGAPDQSYEWQAPGG